MVRSGIWAAVMLIAAGTAQANPCDYRPSRIAGDAAAPATTAAKEAGFYTLNNIRSGGGALGATGALSSAGAVATAPVTIIAGAVAAAGLAGYEGLCYFSDRRVTDYDEVLEVMRNLAANADPEIFRLDGGEGGKKNASVILRNSAGEMEQHAVADLYIVNGELRYRSAGRDGVIGNVDFVARSAFGADAPLSGLKTEDAPVEGEPVAPADAAPTDAAPTDVAPTDVAPADAVPDAAAPAPPEEAATQP